MIRAAFLSHLWFGDVGAAVPMFLLVCVRFCSCVSVLMSVLLHGQGRWTKEHGHGAWTRSMDTKQGQGAGTRSSGKEQGLGPWDKEQALALDCLHFFAAWCWREQG